MSFTGLLKKTLGSGVSQAVKAYVNSNVLEGYGEMVKLEIDPQTKTASASAMLRGEREVLDIRVGSYVIETNGDEGCIYLKDITTSREWVNTLGRNLYPDGVAIPLDGKILSLLKSIV